MPGDEAVVFAMVAGAQGGARVMVRGSDPGRKRLRARLTSG
jgi:hypothetical protein